MDIYKKNFDFKYVYQANLLEDEGVGVTYEYWAKRLWQGRFLGLNNKSIHPPIKKILINGLPGKYGLSLDLFLLADIFGAQVVATDERKQRIEWVKKGISMMKKKGFISKLKMNSLVKKDIFNLKNVGKFDLIINSEVLNRIENKRLGEYFREATRNSQLV